MKSPEFERRFADYHEAKHGIAVVNGTVSLRVALLAAGIEAGDEVIVPPYTFLATATAVVEANATPIFADIELDTFNLDPRAIEAAITPRTKAIIPVHVGGLPVNMDAILDIARRHQLTVIEDAAHAHGAAYRGRRVGAIGQMGSFSFQSTKNLTSGEGGIILTNDDDLAERCRSIHNCGRIAGGAWYEHHVMGGNYRLGEFQGAILNAQMRGSTHRRKPASETENTWPSGWRNCRASFRSLAAPTAQGTATTCSCFGWNPKDSGRHQRSISRSPRGRGHSRLRRLRRAAVSTAAVYVNKAFGPYRGCDVARPALDYRNVPCPNCETICSRQGAWLEQRLLLGTQEDMNDIAAAFEKVYENRNTLRAYTPPTGRLRLRRLPTRENSQAPARCHNDRRLCTA